MSKQEIWDIFEYIEKNNLLDEGFDMCENDEQREYLKNLTREICNLYQPLINNAREMIKTDRDREKFAESILGTKPKVTGVESAD